jgi:hypothetical protein
MSAPVGSVSNQLIINYGILRSGTEKQIKEPTSLTVIFDTQD